jgi:hypothetical protein
MNTRRIRLARAGFAVALLAVAMTALAPLANAGVRARTTPAGKSQCGSFSGTVLLTYSNPHTIILHIIKGKVNAPTTFTMTPTTSYTRNQAAATFADIKIGDTGTITAQAQSPSGVLLACTVSVSGP